MQSECGSFIKVFNEERVQKFHKNWPNFKSWCITIMCARFDISNAFFRNSQIITICLKTLIPLYSTTCMQFLIKGKTLIPLCSTTYMQFLIKSKCGGISFELGLLIICSWKLTSVKMYWPPHSENKSGNLCEKTRKFQFRLRCNERIWHTNTNMGVNMARTGVCISFSRRIPENLSNFFFWRLDE